MQKTIKLGVNRGKPRLWLEGQWLADHGFTRGTRYAVTTHTDKTLRFTVDPNGKRKVSGKTKADGTDHPIIDWNGMNLEEFAGAELSLTINAGVISIRRTS